MSKPIFNRWLTNVIDSVSFWNISVSVSWISIEPNPDRKLSKQIINRYLTDLADNISYKNVSVRIA